MNFLIFHSPSMFACILILAYSLSKSKKISRVLTSLFGGNSSGRWIDIRSKPRSQIDIEIFIMV